VAVLRAVLAFTVAVCGGCGDDGGPAELGPDAANSTDAGVCSEDLELGRCEVVGSGAACIGVVGEMTEFVSLSDGAPVPIVTGPQGAQMFVFAVRTTGIAAGDPDQPSDDDPLVDVIVRRTSYSVVARFRGRVGLAAEPDIDDAFVVSDLFVVIDAEAPVEGGQSLTARGTLRDSAGVERCGTLSFEATQ
jgi:hypothetical protein